MDVEGTSFPTSVCRVLAVIVVVAAGGCSSDVTNPPVLTRTISLDVSSLSMIQGDQRHLTVNVAPNGPSVSLSVESLPTGLTASFSPQTIPAGLTQSVMTITAGSPLETTLIIRASANELVPAVQSETSLRVSVTPCPGYVMPDRCPPFPTGGDLSITGVVVERTAEATRPLENFRVWAWVQRETNGYTAGSIVTGAGGVFTFPTLPPSLVVLQLFNGDWDQPCPAIVQVGSGGAVQNGEVVAQSKPIYDPSPAAPGLTGVIYEQTPAGRRPVPGARVFVEILFETIAATTTTDDEGRYSLCGLPAMPITIAPYKAGYALKYQTLNVTGVMQLDLELVKQ